MAISDWVFEKKQLLGNSTRFNLGCSELLYIVAGAIIAMIKENFSGLYQLSKACLLKRFFCFWPVCLLCPKTTSVSLNQFIDLKCCSCVTIQSRGLSRLLCTSQVHKCIHEWQGATQVEGKFESGVLFKKAYYYVFY